MKICGVYKITSPTGKVYIGQSVDILCRKRSYKIARCKGQRKIHASIVKHGWESHTFEIIHELPKDVNQDVLNTYEKYYVDTYKNAGFELMNIREAGNSGRPSAESIRKMVQTRMDNNSYVTPEHIRVQRSERGKGKPLKGVTREHILQTAEKLRGRNASEESKEKNRQSQIGRIHSEETKKKMSDNAKILWQKRKGGVPSVF